MVKQSASYREQIYSVYASRMQGVAEVFDAAVADGWGRPYARRFAGWLPQDRDVAILDAACGGGRMLHVLRSLGYRRLTGVDVSPEQVALARQAAEHVVQDDVVGFLEKSHAAFDVILGLDIVEHFTKDEVLTFLRACRVALKPGGRLVLQTVNGESAWAGGMRYGDFTHEVCFTPHSLRVVLEVCGFRDVEARECAPQPQGLRSTIRSAAWQVIRLARRASCAIETGSTGSGICTRVFLMSGRRPSEAASEGIPGSLTVASARLPLTA